MNTKLQWLKKNKIAYKKAKKFVYYLYSFLAKKYIPCHISKKAEKLENAA